MKIRKNFVANSSSSSFMVKNTSSEKKDIVDFLEEVKYLVGEYLIRYDFYDMDLFTEEKFVASAGNYQNYQWSPDGEIECIFGDEDGTVAGAVLDYMLRDGGETKSFSWRFHEHLR